MSPPGSRHWFELLHQDEGLQALMVQGLCHAVKSLHSVASACSINVGQGELDELVRPHLICI
jgi:hypothetical protein